jgi:hypothetical protein
VVDEQAFTDLSCGMNLNPGYNARTGSDQTRSNRNAGLMQRVSYAMRQHRMNSGPQSQNRHSANSASRWITINGCAHVAPDLATDALD